MRRNGWMKVMGLSAALAAGGCSDASGSHDASPDGATAATDAVASGDAAQGAADAGDASDLAPTACTDGTPADFPGYTALCTGSMQFYPNPVPVTEGPSPYTFAFVFGDAWPGNRFGYTEVFTLPVGRYVSIPFQPSPAHTVQFNDNSTYHPGTSNIFSISTAPGLFNNGAANGTTVLCVGKSNPDLVVSSDGSQSNCVLPDTNRTYWFNMLPGIVVNGKFSGCTGMTNGTKTFKCAVAVSQQLVH